MTKKVHGMFEIKENKKNLINVYFQYILKSFIEQNKTITIFVICIQ